MILTDDERFKYALDFVLQDEGGYSNDLDDPGGETNFGITQKDLILWANKLHLPSDVKSLTKDDAAVFYKNVWWDKYHYNAINSLNVAAKIFNLAVNIGAIPAAELLQKSLQWCGYGIEADGVIGKKTLAAVNEVCLHGREEDLHNELTEEAKSYYEHLTEENPRLYKFLKGWLRRAEE